MSNKSNIVTVSNATYLENEDCVQQDQTTTITFVKNNCKPHAIITIRNDGRIILENWKDEQLNEVIEFRANIEDQKQLAIQFAKTLVNAAQILEEDILYFHDIDIAEVSKMIRLYSVK